MSQVVATIAKLERRNARLAQDARVLLEALKERTAERDAHWDAEVKAACELGEAKASAAAQRHSADHFQALAEKLEARVKELKGAIEAFGHQAAPLSTCNACYTQLRRRAGLDRHTPTAAGILGDTGPCSRCGGPFPTEAQHHCPELDSPNATTRATGGPCSGYVRIPDKQEGTP